MTGRKLPEPPQLQQPNRLIDQRREDEEYSTPPRVQYLIEKYNRLGFLAQQQQQLRQRQSPSVTDLNVGQSTSKLAAPRRFGSAAAIAIGATTSSSEFNKTEHSMRSPVKAATPASTPITVKRRSSIKDGLIKIGRRISTALRPGETTNNSSNREAAASPSRSDRKKSMPNESTSPGAATESTYRQGVAGSPTALKPTPAPRLQQHQESAATLAAAAAAAASARAMTSDKTPLRRRTMV